MPMQLGICVVRLTMVVVLVDWCEYFLKVAKLNPYESAFQLCPAVCAAHGWQLGGQAVLRVRRAGKCSA